MSLAIGSNVDLINRPLDQRIDTLKEGSYYQKIQEKLALERQQDSKGIWVKGLDKAGQSEYYLDVSKLTTKSYFTTVKTHEGAVSVPLVVKMITGEKISLKDKIENIMDAYQKAVSQSTSHNLMMSRIAGMKMAAFAFILSVLGVPVEELKKLKKQAIEDSIAENLALYEENIYNQELLEIVSGSGGKKMKAERSILDEIQKQLLTQAKRLNIDDYYTQERVLELKIKVNREIMTKFKEEQQHLEYELEYLT